MSCSSPALHQHLAFIILLTTTALLAVRSAGAFTQLYGRPKNTSHHHHHHVSTSSSPPISSSTLRLQTIHKYPISSSSSTALYYSTNTSSASTSARPVSSSTKQNTVEILHAVNEVRADHGLRPLRHSDPLQRAAYAHSLDMTQHNFIGHTGSDRSNVWDRVQAAGVPCEDPKRIGENLGIGPRTVDEVMDYWMSNLAAEKDEMRSHLLNPDYTHFGASEVEERWTAVFVALDDVPSNSSASARRRRGGESVNLNSSYTGGRRSSRFGDPADPNRNQNPNYNPNQSNNRNNNRDDGSRRRYDAHRNYDVDMISAPFAPLQPSTRRTLIRPPQQHHPQQSQYQSQFNNNNDVPQQQVQSQRRRRVRLPLRSSVVEPPAARPKPVRRFNSADTAGVNTNTNGRHHHNRDHQSRFVNEERRLSGNMEFDHVVAPPQRQQQQQQRGPRRAAEPQRRETMSLRSGIVEPAPLPSPVRARTAARNTGNRSSRAPPAPVAVDRRRRRRDGQQEQEQEPRGLTPRRDPMQLNRQMLKIINSLRRTHDLCPLKYNKQLEGAAIQHTIDMVRNDFFSKVGSDKSSIGERVTRAGFKWDGVSENLGFGQEVVQEVIDYWMQSGGRENILNPDYTQFGACELSTKWSAVFAYNLREKPSEHAKDPARLKMDMLAAVNEVRAQHGLSQLIYNDKLEQAARAHTCDMVQQDFMSHHGSDGGQVWDRVTRTGYSWAAVAENLASGQRDIPQVMDSWMKSPGHRVNILDPQHTHFGMCEMSYTWTQVFAADKNLAVGNNDDVDDYDDDVDDYDDDDYDDMNNDREGNDDRDMDRRRRRDMPRVDPYGYY